MSVHSTRVDEENQVTCKQPLLRPVPQRDMYVLCEDYTRYFKVDGVTRKVTVPEGFIFDGASIPKWAWQVIYSPFHPDVMAAALVHDYLYGHHKFTRIESDSIFEYLLIKNGVDETKASLMYKAVRVGGRSAWEIK